jgi:hypothetical protein
LEPRETLPRLRGSLDSNDTFVSGGHGVIKTAGATRHAERMRKIPVWALDDEKIKQFIESRFPNTKTDSEQYRLASRMIRLIYLYYRTGATAQAVAEELKITRGAVKTLIHRISKAMGQVLKLSHRPKKGVPIQATYEGSGVDHSSL